MVNTCSMQVTEEKLSVETGGKHFSHILSANACCIKIRSVLSCFYLCPNETATEYMNLFTILATSKVPRGPTV